MARSGHINHRRRAEVMRPTDAQVRAYEELVRQIREKQQKQGAA